MTGGGDLRRAEARQTRGTVIGLRRGVHRGRWLAFVGGGVLVGLLGGCFIYDAPNPQIWYHNLTDQGLVVTIEGADIPGF